MEGLRCRRCGHKGLSRTETNGTWTEWVCPKCMSLYRKNHSYTAKLEFIGVKKKGLPVGRHSNAYWT